jgi:hypothetical protein
MGSGGVGGGGCAAEPRGACECREERKGGDGGGAAARRWRVVAAAAEGWETCRMACDGGAGAEKIEDEGARRNGRGRRTGGCEENEENSRCIINVLNSYIVFV